MNTTVNAEALARLIARLTDYQLRRPDLRGPISEDDVSEAIDLLEVLEAMSEEADAAAHKVSALDEQIEELNAEIASLKKEMDLVEARSIRASSDLQQAIAKLAKVPA